jgi:hypothetical protein
MKIKSLIAATLVLTAAPLAAHHGWSSFDQDAPVYLEGPIKSVRWQNPHAEAVVEVAAGQKLPADLAARTLPAQSQSVDGAALMKKVQPATVAGEWELEFAPLSRMQAWGLEQPLKAGDRIEVVGYAAPKLGNGRLMRVEYLFVNGKAYALRSSPAGR